MKCSTRRILTTDLDSHRPRPGRAAKVARKTARMHGTPVYVGKNGKVVAEKP